MNVKIQKTHHDGRIPTYATDGSGAIDFYSAEEVAVEGLQVRAIDLGVAMEVPEGHVMLLFPRSSIGKNTNLRMANSVGVIDSDYRGTIHALYENRGNIIIWNKTWSWSIWKYRGIKMTEEEIKQAKEELNELTLTMAYWPGENDEKFKEVMDKAWDLLVKLRPYISEYEYWELYDYYGQAIVWD